MRDYQRLIVLHLLQNVTVGSRKVVAVLKPGLGKSFMAMYLAFFLARYFPDYKIIVVHPS